MPISIAVRVGSFPAPIGNISQYVLRYRAGHPDYLRGVGGRVVPIHNGRIDTGSDINVLPYHLLRYFQLARVDDKAIRKFWLDPLRTVFGHITKRPYVGAGGLGSTLPYLVVSGSMELTTRDNRRVILDGLPFGFHAPADILADISARADPEKGSRVQPDVSETYLVGQATIQRLRFFLPSANATESVAPVAWLRSENCTVKCQPV